MQSQFTVDAQFILDAHKVACQGWKEKIENKFPKLFGRKNERQEIIYRKWKDGQLETKKYYFAIGDKVRVNDGSYNIDARTGEERAGIDDLFRYSEAKIIALNTGKMYSTSIGINLKCTLNLLLEFPKGQLIYCAPNCVNSIT